jgi:hypothetical protein
MKSSIEVKETDISITTGQHGDCISLTDMLRAKDGEFFISDWLRNRNTLEFLDIWESFFTPDFSRGEFATISSQVGLNSYEWVVGHQPDAKPFNFNGIGRTSTLNALQ